ncbi:hypothetical protein ACWERV_16980 [Streptomyces sp. NPDC004031]
MTIPATFLAAPAQAPTIQGGHILGTITLSGLALGAAIALILGTRKADRLKVIHTRDGIGVAGIVTGTLWIAAGGAWASTAASIGSVPTSVLGPGSGLGDPGAGGVALALTLLTFGPKWRRTIWPALLGVSAAAAYGVAGGVWGIAVNIIRMVITHLTGGH